MNNTTRVTKRIKVYGIVQGVGFRPTVKRHADEAGISGSVCNCGPYVEIYASGTADRVDRFLDLLKNQPPKRAAILKMDVRDLTGGSQAGPWDGFEIIESEKTTGEIFISPDIAICDECKAELFDRTNRRYLHPFINCTCCGPRLTILDTLPYDRERTSMKEFPMCPDCAEEYHNQASRRYDAQPVCCPDCGPVVYELISAGGSDAREAGSPVTGDPVPSRGLTGAAAITRARQVISSGGIVAVKGIGGFHLCCDATDSKAVEKLRQRKNRPVKPFAVMAADIETAERECRIEPYQREVLTGHQKPIVLLEKKSGGRVCQAAAPGNPKLGVMLPYAPVQLLLFHYDDDVRMPDCLIMTSANASGAPICRDDEGALRELSGLADYILSNDRKIRLRADDTVMDFFEGRPYMIRRSRGYAPLPFMMAEGENPGRHTVMAVGGELKNSFCIATGGLYYPSPYIGDLADLRTVKALEESTGRFEDLLEVRPEMAVSDLHPGYNSTAFAEGLGLPLVRVQHHYAHILSCMAENGFTDKVIGVAFDGTGYGEDGTIWGGEILLADRDGYERIGSIDKFQQCGGDLSAKEGWRIAASLLLDGRDLEEAAKIAADLGLSSDQEMRMTAMMRARGINTVTSTSAGRLFDAVSAMLGICRASSFEGEASMKLQYAALEGRTISETPAVPDAESAGPGPEQAPPAPEKSPDDPDYCLIHTGRLFEDLLSMKLKGTDEKIIAWEFHRRLALETADACEKAADRTGVRTAALSGGVFQNTLLLELLVTELRKRGFHVLTHSMVPPNDGGIALGQAAYAVRYIN